MSTQGRGGTGGAFSRSANECPIRKRITVSDERGFYLGIATNSQNKNERAGVSLEGARPLGVKEDLGKKNIGRRSNDARQRSGNGSDPHPYVRLLKFTFRLVICRYRPI